jgi:hypothetical protein
MLRYGMAIVRRDVSEQCLRELKETTRKQVSQRLSYGSVSRMTGALLSQ